MLKDLRHAVRVLLQAKAWTTVVVLSLALGIGANTALFSAINGLLLTDVPVKDPDSLVRLRYVGRNDMVTSSSSYGYTAPDPNNVQVRSSFSYPMYQQFLTDNRTMTDLFAFAPIGRVNVVVDGHAEVASAYLTTGNYYQALGVRTRLGRTLLPDDDRADAPPAAVISSKYWHSRFGSDPRAVGRSITVSNVPVTIVGVLAPEFTGVQQIAAEPPDVWLPLALDTQLTTSPPGSGPPRLMQPTYWWLLVMGRLKPGATTEQVEGNLGGPFQQTARAGLDSFLQSLSEQERGNASNQNRKEVPRLRVESGRHGYYDVHTSEWRSISILTGVVAMVLLIVCANVANLLLSRATTRQKELSVRLSLGATRGRLIRQLLTESLLLAGVGGALGILVGYWGRQLLPGAAGRMTGLDWRILLFVLAVSVLTGILFGIAPALRGTGMNVSSALKETGRSVVGSRSVLGKSLLIVQVAISLVLLVGAGLFLRTLSNLRQVDVGFNPENLLLFRVSPQMNRYDEKRSAVLYQNMMERVSAVPGVRGVAMSQPALLTGSVNSTSIFVQGRTYSGNVRDLNNSIHRVVVSPNFFEVLQIPLLTGRGFNQHDTSTSAKVAVINEAAVRRYFPDEQPLGRRFGSSVETTGQLEIVGIVRDARYDSLRDAVPPTMYVPYTQTRFGSAVFEVRTAGSATAVTGSIREAVRQIDPNLPVMDVSTQIEQVEMRFSQEKLFARAYALFGGIALLLASIGLFGLMSYNVSRRTNEIGIRMALGAQRTDVLRLVLRESMILVVAGIVIGLAAAFGAVRYVETLLFGLPPRDLTSIALAVVVMVIVSAFAGYLPARLASRVDPMVALHYE